MTAPSTSTSTSTSAFTSASSPTDPVGAVAEEYFDALHRADEARAVDLTWGLLDDGLSVDDVLLRLVAPAQTRVGLMWQTGRWNIAQEHAATCIAERVVGTVGARTRPVRQRGGQRGGQRGHVVVACLDGEWHALAARIVGEVLRAHSFTVTFLGASVPPAHLVSFLHQHGPDVVALSTALPIHLPAAHRTIVAAQRTGTPVLVGGPGFGADGRWAHRLGVDAWAPTPTDAVVLLEQRACWPAPEAAGSAGPHDVGHGSEYAGVRQRRGSLVVAGTERLRAGAGPEGAPATLSDSPADDDLGQVADVLAAAAYLGDRRLFTDHLRWLAAVCACRGTAHVLPDVLDVFRAELHDFPFAQACLDEGRTVLARQEGQ